jgi:phycocyanin-associated, rod
VPYYRGFETGRGPVAPSGNTFMQVPRDRMNETMRRITKLGGKIVSISSLSPGAAPTAPEHE